MHIDIIKTQGKGPGIPFGVISPPGYQPYPGLVDLPPYKKEAEELPEKPPAFSELF